MVEYLKVLMVEPACASSGSTSKREQAPWFIDQPFELRGRNRSIIHGIITYIIYAFTLSRSNNEFDSVITYIIYALCLLEKVSK
jgi:hypothetical protein